MLGFTLRSVDSIACKHYSGHHEVTEEECKPETPATKSGKNVDSRFQVQLEEVVQERAGWRRVLCCLLHWK